MFVFKHLGYATLMLFAGIFYPVQLSAEGESISSTHGSVRGTVVDQNTGETIIGASVIIEGTLKGAATDINGNFQINDIEPGTYNIKASFVSYETVVVEGVQVEAGKVSRLNISMAVSEIALDEVQVAARRVTHTEMSVLASIRNANLVVSGISSQQIRRSQDGDAAAVVRRVPGVTLVDNRFVMIRGLSERYNASMLHNVYAPSMETDVRSFSFDIIPSNLIDRIMIFKSPAADLPGDFAGGVVRVYTRSFPEQDGIQVSYSASYEPGVSFQQFKGQENGNFHWLNRNNRSNSLPGGFPDNLRAIANDQNAIMEAGQKLGNNWLPLVTNSGLNQSIHITGGLNFNIRNIEVGHITALSFNNSKGINDISRADFNAFDISTQHKSYLYQFNDQKHNQKIRTSLLHNWAFNLGQGHTLEFRNQLFHLSNSDYVMRTGNHFDFGYYANNHSFHKIYRGIYSGQLSGNHQLWTDRTTLDWTLGYGYSYRDEPDYRRFRSDIDPNTGETTLYVPFGAAAAFFLGRFFSEMEENNYTGLINLTHKLSFDRFPGFIPTLKAGLFFEDKSRFFQARNLGYIRSNILQFDQSLLSQGIYQLFRPENINNTTGIRLDEQTNPSDSYRAINNLWAGYVQVQMPFSRKLNMVMGLRTEHHTQRMHSFSLTNQPIDVVRPQTSFLPSANISYNFNSRMLIRGAYGKTLNRPEFRELAPFGFYDFNFNLVKRGNEMLQTAYIHNTELRYEFYPSESEIISVGVFYKHFLRPIESKFTDGGGSGGIKTFTYENADHAVSMGMETEVRKSLMGLTNSTLVDRISVLFNAALIHSRVELGQAGLGQVNANRPMQGQSPFIVNAGLFYEGNNDLRISLLYNIVGQRIFIIGYHSYPDIYEMPRNHLDLTISRTIARNLRLNMGIRDMLNENIVLMQDANQDGNFDLNSDQVIQSFRPGTRFSLGLSYTF
ncbi:MAG TPA: TonB-dependent receptor [Bacteroidales bacterium]|nr:TonB-dependent receptor [Bacteroidales bacterium]